MYLSMGNSIKVSPVKYFQSNLHFKVIKFENQLEKFDSFVQLELLLTVTNFENSYLLYRYRRFNLYNVCFCIVSTFNVLQIKLMWKLESINSLWIYCVGRYVNIVTGYIIFFPYLQRQDYNTYYIFYLFVFY
jgi:hypothetical protein